jgi:hypothetical protein
MVIWLQIETSVIGKDGTKMEGQKEGVRWGDIWELLHLVAFVCAWVYFYCCSGVCLCQGLQGLGVYIVSTIG